MRLAPPIASRLAVCLCCVLLAACASPGSRQPVEEGDARSADPIERANRGSFRFNDALDRALLRPIAIGWTWITPAYLRAHIAQMFANLNFPGQLVNNLLQGDVRQSGVELARFVTNSTVGVAGFFDPASSLGLDARHEDFGQTLGVWGAGPGAYVVLPFMGSTGVRDLVAYPVDAVLNVGDSPLYGFVFGLPGSAATAVRDVNGRSLAIDQVDQARAAALDFYVFVRDVHRRQREAAIANTEGLPTDSEGDDLYELDEDDE